MRKTKKRNLVKTKTAVLQTIIVAPHLMKMVNVKVQATEENIVDIARREMNNVVADVENRVHHGIMTDNEI